MNAICRQRILHAALLVCHLLTLSSQEDGSTITVHVEKIQSISGTLHVCLMSPTDDFLQNCSFGQSVKVTSPEMTLRFEDIPSGTYCISLFQDLDQDKKLATEGLFGLPSEPWGFSNNPRLLFGPPNFKRCQFALVEDLEVTIRLR